MATRFPPAPGPLRSMNKKAKIEKESDLFLVEEEVINDH